MVTRLDERTRATSTAREKRSRGCGSYATRRRIQSSTISSASSTCRCRPLRHGWQQRKARRMKRLRCCAEPPKPKIFWASIRCRRARLFPFANSSALYCSKWVKRRKHSENLKPRSKSTRDDSEVYTERRLLPSKLGTSKTRAAITQNSPHKRKSKTAHEMN